MELDIMEGIEYLKWIFDLCSTKQFLDNFVRFMEYSLIGSL